MEEHGAYSQKSKSGFLGLSKSGKSKLETQATQVSSELEAGNDLILLAGNDVRLRASTAVAGNDTEIRAGLVTDTGDINLVSAQDAAYSLQESYRSKVGLSSSGNSISVASARKSGQEAMSSTAVGSQVVSERDTLLQAERDINVEGSRVVAGRNMTLDAGRDVNVVAATNSSSESQWNRTSQVGLSWGSDANSVSVFAGKEGEQLRQAVVTNTASGSELLAGNDIQVSAGRTINQIGSALEAGRDIRMDAEENINILAAQESSVSDHQYSSSRQGIGVSVNHNYGNARDAAGNAGKGDNAVSQASGVLRAVDSISQFFAGPTAEMRIGSSSESVRQQQSIQGAHGSTLAAGNDVILNAGNDVTVTGSRLGAGRDVSVAGRDIIFDVATGASSQQTEQQQSWAGVRGGNAGGLRAGIGFSQGESTQEGVQGTSTVSQISAGRDITLEATNNLTLVGTQAQAGRNIDLDAGNDIRILAAQNAFTADTNRSSSGMEVGATFGQDGVGFYASGNQGRGFSEREGVRHQEAYLYAGDRLSFTSGRDTTIAGAQLSGQEVVGRVGRDLTVASVIDTGSARGRESDVSATVTVGPSPGASGSAGSGRTSGSTQWVESQTSIIARDRLDIYTENHTQLDGALIASETGNLTLDTGSLGFTDITGHDRERSHYVSVGGSYGIGDSNVQQDQSQVGKGDSGVSGWSVEGNKYERDRQQNVRATVGEGEIIVRGDAETGDDSTAGLNRDVDRAYEITRDREESTDLYVTGSSVAAVANPVQTAEAWADGVASYLENTQGSLSALLTILEGGAALINGPQKGDEQIAVLHAEIERAVEISLAQLAEDISSLNADTETAEGLTMLYSRAQQLSEENPVVALYLIGSLLALTEKDPSALREKKTNSIELSAMNLLPVAIPLAGSLLVALGLYGAADSVASKALSDSLNAVVNGAKDQPVHLMAAAAVWYLTTGMVFPVHQLSPEHSRLMSPIVAEQDWRGLSPGGYVAVGGQASHTGGSQLDRPMTTPSTERPADHQGGLGVVYSEASDGAKGIRTIIEPKIAQQLGKRGWTADTIENVIANPGRTVVTKDTRFDPISGTRLNDPATGYVSTDGSYVVRNDRTGAIVQVSDRNDKNWVAPWD